jgi:hypothetical protein
MRPVIKPYIVQYNEDDYDVLRTYLFDALGPYCSYCEAPISNDSAVEHKVPKETLSRFATAWYNLLIACQSCNSAKGQTPLNKNNNYRDTLAQWVWPDKTEQLRSDPRPGLPVDETYKLLTYEYSSKTQVQLQNAGIARNAQVTMPWSTTAYRMLWVLPNATTIGTNTTLETRVKTTIARLNLNSYDSSSSAYNDRRVINRTAAYTAAVATQNNLETAVRIAGGNARDARVLLVIQACRQTIIATGFWSVWFWVFRSALQNPPLTSYWHQFSQADRRYLLEALLIYYISPAERANANESIFAGTDYDRLNMGSFT